MNQSPQRRLTDIKARSTSGSAAVEEYCLFDTKVGVCGIAWSDAGLRRLQLPERDSKTTKGRLRARTASRAAPPMAIEGLIANLQHYFKGGETSFAGVALDLAGISAFNRCIYAAARKVGWGRTLSYGELARRAGYPQGARAVGQALGRNPIPIIVPCHRIVASGGKIGGFSAFGGASTKLRLLALEGVSTGQDAERLPGI